MVKIIATFSIDIKSIIAAISSHGYHDKLYSF